ncbi:cytochrome P450 [Flagelloscypha sp. PMI_526]|nr:cytochrome P450 [Flagelloscypha sp. PMI_526]
MLIYSVALGFLVLVVGAIARIGARGKDLPPGPPTTPLLGNAHIFPKTWAHIQLTYWARVFGDVYSLMIGPGTVVVLSSYTAVAEVLDKQASLTGDRPHTTLGERVTGGYHMAQAHYHDPMWSLTRKLSRSMMTIQKCNELLPIQRGESIQFMYDVLHDPKNFAKHAARYTYSTISSVLYGARFPRYESKEVIDFYHMITVWSQLMEPGRHPPVDLIPLLKYVPERWAPWKRDAAEVRRLQRGHYCGLLDRVKKRLATGESVGAFMETIVRDQASVMEEELMVYLGGVLMEGGTDTTLSYFKTLHLAMTAYPEAQRKAQEEIDRVVGPDRLPNLQDIKNLPYIQACIRETIRWRPSAPLSLPHATTEDVYYRGYRIPKGTTLFMNLWAIFHDEDLFERPDEFWPDRFMQSEYGTRKGVDTSHCRQTLIFGSGKRICPGINLATNSVDMNTMFLLWGFNFLKAKDPKTGHPIDPDINNFTEGLFTAPCPFECDIKPRSPQHAEIIDHAMRDGGELFARYELDLSREDQEFIAQRRKRLQEI